MKIGDYYNFFYYIQKVSEKTYYKRNRETILNRAKKYYENNKKVLRDNVRNKYRNLSEQKKQCKKRI